MRDVISGMRTKRIREWRSQNEWKLETGHGGAQEGASLVEFPVAAHWTFGHRGGKKTKGGVSGEFGQLVARFNHSQN